MNSKLFILAFLISFGALSQERKVLGRVLDVDTQKPVKNANIVILGTTSGTFSNQLGFFEITIDPSKHKTLVVSHIGFETSEILIPAEDRIKFSLKKEYILMGQLNLSRYPRKVIDKEQGEPKSDNEVTGIELGATYPNGLNSFYDFIGNSLTSQIPEGNQKAFDVAFTINEEGRAVEISISDTTASIKNAVIKTFEKMADWTPAMQRQNKASQHFVLPIVWLKGDVTSLDL
ncbi:MAG TPA: carboxypeptidase-like regulatory domain-containing protein, partial [Chryseolinea sp.]